MRREGFVMGGAVSSAANLSGLSGLPPAWAGIRNLSPGMLPAQTGGQASAGMVGAGPMVGPMMQNKANLPACPGTGATLQGQRSGSSLGVTAQNKANSKRSLKCEVSREQSPAAETRSHCAKQSQFPPPGQKWAIAGKAASGPQGAKQSQLGLIRF